MREHGLALVACSMLLTARAHALDAEITSTTGAQGYTLRSPFGQPVITRRRFMQTLGLNVVDPDANPDDMQVSFRMLLRLDDWSSGSRLQNWWTAPLRRERSWSSRFSVVCTTTTGERHEAPDGERSQDSRRPRPARCHGVST